jgi:hypothetical protein
MLTAIDIESRDVGNNNENLLGMVVYNEDETYKSCHAYWIQYSETTIRISFD